MLLKQPCLQSRILLKGKIPGALCKFTTLARGGYEGEDTNRESLAHRLFSG